MNDVRKNINNCTDVAQKRAMMQNDLKPISKLHKKLANHDETMRQAVADSIKIDQCTQETYEMALMEEQLE